MRVRIVVADQSEADFYDMEKREQPPRFVARFTDPDAHLHNRDLKSDRPGRVFDHAASPGGRRGATAHHATGSEHDPRWIEAQRFARKIAAALETAREHGEFDRLVVMAPPAFLGLLRDAIPTSVRTMIAGEIAKNLVHEPVTAMQSHLPAGTFASSHRPVGS